LKNFPSKISFTRKDDGPSIEECLKAEKSIWKKWRGIVHLHLQGDVALWWGSLDYDKMMALSDE
jgi:hypothetical protein